MTTFYLKSFRGKLVIFWVYNTVRHIKIYGKTLKNGNMSWSNLTMLSPNRESVFPDQILFFRKLMFETAIIPCNSIISGT
jgi:hypothetical protein